ncbi:MAG: PEP-CTERM sorting domain-containing protein [Pirellulales bacterium]
MKRCIWAVGLAVVVPWATLVTATEFRGIGEFSPERVSDRGAIVLALIRGYPFVWSDVGGLQPLPAGFGAADLTPDGQLLVGSLSYAPAKMRLGQSPEILPQVGFYPFKGLARAVSADGETIVGDASNQAVRWGANGAAMFEGFSTGPYPWDPRIEPISMVSVSDDGSAAAGVAGLAWIDSAGNPQGGTAPFRWTESAGIRVMSSPWPEAREGKAVAISADGKRILSSYWNPTGYRTYLWTNTAIFNLGNYSADGMSADGKTVIMHANGSYVWREGFGTIPLEDFLDVDLTGWSPPIGSLGSPPLRASAISRDGTVIVGVGALNGVDTAWMATLAVPEPSTLVLGMLGLCALAAYGARFRRAR